MEKTLHNIIDLPVKQIPVLTITIVRNPDQLHSLKYEWADETWIEAYANIPQRFEATHDIVEEAIENLLRDVDNFRQI